MNKLIFIYLLVILAQVARSRSFILVLPASQEVQGKYSTVEAVLNDRPIGHENMLSPGRWSLVAGSVALKCGFFYQECLVLQDRWSLMAVVY